MGASPDDKATADRKAAIAFLEKVASGAIPLFAPANAALPASTGATVVMQSAGSMFARGDS
jgi:phage gp36-like protein